MSGYLATLIALVLPLSTTLSYAQESGGKYPGRDQTQAPAPTHRNLPPGAISPDSSFVVAAYGDSFLYNPRTGLDGIPFVKDVYRPFGFSGNGRYFLYLKAVERMPTFALFQYDLTDGTDIPVTTRKVFQAAWAPQGADIAYLTMESAQHFTLYVHDTGSGTSRKIDEGMLEPERLAWSQDGRQILYTKLTPKSANYFEDGQLDRVDYRYDTGSEAIAEDGTNALLEQLPDGETRQAIRRSFGPSTGKYVHAIENGESRVKRWNSQSQGFDVAAEGRVYSETRDGLVLREFTQRGVVFRYVPDAGGDARELRTVGRPAAIGPSARDGRELARAAAFAGAWKLPFAGASLLDQGGELFAGGACDGRACKVGSHKRALGYALDWTQVAAQGPAHILAPEEGTVAAVLTTVTCNSIQTACTATVDAYANPCPNTGGAGNYVVLAHADGSFTLYAHMRSFSSPLSVGQTVLPGDYLGDQGHTGGAGSSIVPCGDHLHYQRQVDTSIWGQSIPTDFTELPCQLSCMTNYTSQNTDNSAPPSVANLTLALVPSTAAAGSSNPSNRVILPAAAPPGGTLVTLTSASPDVVVPASVVVPQGTRFASFLVSVAATANASSVIITGQSSTETATATLTVKKIAIQSLVLSPTSVVGANTTAANQITLTEMPAQDISLSASSSKTAAVVPSNVVIPAGSTFTQFPIQTSIVAATVTAGITVSSGNSTKSANLQVTPLVPQTLTVPSPVVGGGNVSATLTMNASVGGAPAVVDVTSSDASVSVTGNAVTVDAGTASKVFTISTVSVSSPVTATLTATFNGVSRTANLTVNPLMVSSVSLGSFNVAGGANIGNNFVTLNGPPSPGDAVIELSSSDPVVAPVPATITIPAGATQSPVFTIPTTAVGATTPVNIIATFNGIAKTVVLTVNPVIFGQTIWNSYDVITQSGTPQATVADISWQKTATVELYESTNNLGVNKGNLFATFTSGLHPAVFNNVQDYWSAAGGQTYPYVGKSIVGRGLETEETNTAAPSGVFDLQLHAPNNDHLAVAAFQIPENGNYQVTNLAARRIDGNPNQTIRYYVFNAQKIQIASLQATSNQAWVADPNTYALGQLTAGQYIYFGVGRDGAYSWDATEISWSIKKIEPLPDFNIQATPPSQSVAPGGGTTFSATATALNGFSGTINLAVSGLPGDATGNFSPSTLTGGGSATLTVATNGAAPGSYPLTITASSGALTHTANVTLVITGPPDFTLNATPASRTVVAGGSTTFTVTGTAQNGFTGVIGFNVTGLPVGASPDFNPATLNGGGSSTLTLSTGGGTLLGSYPLTITATSGALTHITSVTLNITAAAQATVWNSYDVVTQAGAPQAVVTDMAGLTAAVVELYESTNNFGVNKGSLFATFAPGAHPATFNNVQAYWSAAGGQTYPYGGKSTVGRGSDAGEANAAAPSGVFDLQLHPPNNDHLAVAAFQVPRNGSYQVNNLAARRIDGNPNQTIRYYVFNSQKVQIATLQATSSRAWVADPNTYALGQLTAGQYIYFGVARDGAYSWDATEINWSITEVAPVPDFTFGATPSSQSVLTGGGTTFSATATALNGFSGTIDLAVSGLPVGATGNFSPTTLTGGGSATLTVATNGAAPGSYPLTITATSGALTHTAPVTLTITVPGQTMVWNSYDVTTQAGVPQATVTDTSGTAAATVELYESTNNLGVNKASLFTTFTPGLHPATFNNVQAYWSAAGGQTYPYVGKSTVGRGLDTGETNAAAPGGVFDLQLHPPNNDRLAVAAFLVPQDGTYTLSNLAARRLDGNANQTIRYLIFNPQKVQIANVQATSNRAWVADPASYSLGQLTTGQYIYFGVARDGLYAWDATEISWTITKGP